METSVAETYHTHDEELRAYREHLLSKQALEETVSPDSSHFTADLGEPIYGD